MSPFSRVILAVVIVLVAIMAMGGCATVPPPPPPKPIEHHPVVGIVFLLCGRPVAIEVIREDGFVYFDAREVVSDSVWGAGLLIVESLGENGLHIDLLSDCTKASTL